MLPTAPSIANSQAAKDACLSSSSSSVTPSTEAVSSSSLRGAQGGDVSERDAATTATAHVVAIALFCGEHCEYGLVTDKKRLRPMAVSDPVPRNIGMGARRLQSFRVAVEEAKELLKGAVEQDDNSSSSDSSSNDDEDDDDEDDNSNDGPAEDAKQASPSARPPKRGGRRKNTCKRSKYTGVFWHRNMKKWQCSIRTKKGRDQYLGVYEKEEDAARRYDQEAPKHGRALNFPQSCGDTSEFQDSAKVTAESTIPSIPEAIDEDRAPFLPETTAQPPPAKKKTGKCFLTKTKKPVLHIDKETGVLIEEFESAAAAGDKLGVHYTMVGKVCNGRIEHARGSVFRWKLPSHTVFKEHKKKKKKKQSSSSSAAVPSLSSSFLIDDVNEDVLDTSCVEFAPSLSTVEAPEAVSSDDDEHASLSTLTQDTQAGRVTRGGGQSSSRASINPSSDYAGVFWSHTKQLWKACIMLNGVRC